MTEDLKRQAEILKISDFGVVKARVFDDLCLALRTRKATAFVKATPEERSNPFLIMPEAKSLIVCLFSYNVKEQGSISRYAMGKDYHNVIREKLEEFSIPLKNAGYRTMCFADSWGMNERYLAVEAGLGFIGKNGMLISEKFGSFVFIGTILTDCELEPSKKIEKSCAGCNRCIESCPGGALGEKGDFFEERCLSAITQKKGELTKEEAELIKREGKIWGCDRCQEVCPHNYNKPYTQIQEFSENLITHPELDEKMSNNEFKKVYADKAFSWRGIKPLLRNMKILEEKQK